eukprot:TRINITY_DN22014_c0_g2_i1.p1 TRINITY_DN22014_c0_g2~~TRINITY_DN22014_c0_g2_i1.p1  ORF type:complete len:663 (+),score=55.29 TRINITY_DN22014_c0_g2_i1:65-1990(+)
MAANRPVRPVHHPVQQSASAFTMWLSDEVVEETSIEPMRQRLLGVPLAVLSMTVLCFILPGFDGTLGDVVWNWHFWIGILCSVLSSAFLAVFLTTRTPCSSQLVISCLVYAATVCVCSFWILFQEMHGAAGEQSKRAALYLKLGRFCMALVFVSNVLVVHVHVCVLYRRVVIPKPRRRVLWGMRCGALTKIFLTAGALVSLLKSLPDIGDKWTDSLDILHLAGLILTLVPFMVFYSVVWFELILSARAAQQELDQSDDATRDPRLGQEAIYHTKTMAKWTMGGAIASLLYGLVALVRELSQVMGESTPPWWKDMEEACNHVRPVLFLLNLVINMIVLLLLSGVVLGREYNNGLMLTGQSAEVQRHRAIERELMCLHGKSAGSALMIATLMESSDAQEVLADARARFRCISWEVLSQRSDIIIGGQPLDGSIVPNGEELYALSEPCFLGSCDVFFSHSWHDDSNLKWAALHAWCEDFRVKNGRPPRLWLDKVCVDQCNVERDLRCLPVFLAGCNTLFATSGRTFPNRLWCCMELMIYKAMLGSDSDREPPEVWLLGETEAQCEVQREQWRHFKVSECDCFDPADKERFLQVVAQYPDGARGFNRFVRCLTLDMKNSFFRRLSEEGHQDHELTRSYYDFTERC